jgi:hypothetical protein
MEVALSVNPTHTMRVVKMKLGAYTDKILSDQGIAGGSYLDQFPLDRIPSSKKYFSIPPYCGEGRDISAHLWIGPGTTVLSFHKDNHNALVPIDNIFVRVHGRKQVLLASPKNDDFMYPRAVEEGAQWHSQVDPQAQNFDRYPLFSKAVLQEAILGPGDVLFIPRDYWHSVRASAPSISMSFWWVPFRLSAICGVVSSLSSEEFDKARTSGRLAISQSDVEEFGGTTRLLSIYRESRKQSSPSIPWYESSGKL